MGERLPAPGRLAYYGALGVMAIAGALEWPVAAAIGAGVWVASRHAQAQPPAKTTPPAKAAPPAKTTPPAKAAPPAKAVPVSKSARAKTAHAPVAPADRTR